jgi:hypothetical protein
MEKTRKLLKKIMLIGTFLTGKVWVNIGLLLTAAILIGSGIYINTNCKEAQTADVTDYNNGLSDYNSTEYIPASDWDPPVYEVINILRVVASFQQAASESTDNVLKSMALYNIGTLIGRDYLVFMAERTPGLGLAEAIDELAEAVRLNPDDEDAKYNLEFLERLLTMKQEAGESPEYLAGGAIMAPPVGFKGY